MVCKNCKKEFSAELARCPWCGSPNDLSALHRQNMDSFRLEYDQTEETESGKIKRFSQLSLGAKQTALLAGAVILFLVLLFTVWAVRQDSGRIYAKLHAGEIKAEIQALLEEGSYKKLGKYSSELGLLSSTDLIQKYAEYETRLRASEDLYRLHGYLMQNNTELTADQLADLYRDTDPEYTSEKDPVKIGELDEIRADASQLLTEYYELSEADLARLPSCTSATIESILKP